MAEPDHNDHLNDKLGDFADTISRVLSHVVDESALLQRVEKILDPRPACLFNTDAEREEMNIHINKLVKDSVKMKN